MANRNCTYCCQYFDKDLDCSSVMQKSWDIHFHLALDWNNVVWTIWWLKQSIKSWMLNKSFIAITNTSCIYLFSCVWVFCLLKGRKVNVLPTLTFSYTKETRGRVGLAGYLNLDFMYGMYLKMTLFLKKKLFIDAILFDLCVFHK